VAPGTIHVSLIKRRRAGIPPGPDRHGAHPARAACASGISFDASSAPSTILVAAPVYMSPTGDIQASF
jgi:hypothetical protein